MEHALRALVMYGVMCCIAGSLGQATCVEDVRSSDGVDCSEEYMTGDKTDERNYKKQNYEQKIKNRSVGK